jgi:hypothetical protein
MSSEDELMRELGEVISARLGNRVDTRALADAAYSARRLDAELAMLTFDSATEPGATAGTRAPTEARHLRFDLNDVAIEIDVEVDENDRLELTGVVQPPVPATITLEIHEHGWAGETAVDDFGRFSFQGVVHGPMELRVQRRGAEAIITEVRTI